MAEGFGFSKPIARKEHECMNCGAPIRAGTVYLRYCWADGGVAGTVRVHPRCNELWFEIGYTSGDVMGPGDQADFRQDCHDYAVGPFPWEEVPHVQP